MVLTLSLARERRRRIKLYFAGSIRGGRDDAKVYHQIIVLLAQYGTVLTEHVGDPALTPAGEDGLSDEAIYKRDMAWLRDADVVIAEVTTPSHGVGYEIAQAEAMGKPTLCLRRQRTGCSPLSAMLAGNPRLRCQSYNNVEDLRPILEQFLRHAKSQPSSSPTLRQMG